MACGREMSCNYRAEDYRVRDNGAVLRRAKEGKRRRPLYETWIFGTPNKSDGYKAISGHKVHRIVATAFLGEQPSKGHIVDHIDTNRRNNRPDNLRWVTRLKNILLNPVTAKRVEYLYGSIEEFLADPRNPKNGTLTADFEWMRTVTKDEAEYSLSACWLGRYPTGHPAVAAGRLGFRAPCCTCGRAPPRTRRRRRRVRFSATGRCPPSFRYAQIRTTRRLS